ncbi:UNVERIFIED_CONTAM: putative E3 ubiquitin-protein ligase HIP1 [Sesamum angustifolium]|uniref:RING-type E3 ubiquitin transferase n=1 Tax=Sesamum angustifolium TaxID=2727405 RepID=A0AAW2IN24_9LAMI
MGLTTDAASVDCVVSRRPPRGKVDGVDRIFLGQRRVSFLDALSAFLSILLCSSLILILHWLLMPMLGSVGKCTISCAQISTEVYLWGSYTVRRMVTPEDNPPHLKLGLPRIRSDVSGSRHRHIRHGFREGLAEIVMLQNSLLMGGRSDGLDRYRDLRLDVDNMSYEELLELGDRIGYVSTGLREDEIACCLRRTKLAMLDDLPLHLPRKWRGNAVYARRNMN